MELGFEGQMVCSGGRCERECSVVEKQLHHTGPDELTRIAD